MATWIGGPVLDPLGAALGAGLAQGIDKYYQKKALTSDTDALMEYLRRMQMAQQVPGSAINTATQAASQAAAAAAGFPGGIMGPVVPQDLSGMVTPPQLKTPQMQQMLLQMELGKILSPLEQAQIRGIDAQAMRDKAEAQRSMQPDPQFSEPVSIAGKTYQMGPDGRIHVVDEEKSYQPIMLHNPQTGAQTEWTPGKPIPEGGPWQKVGSGPSTVVNVGTGGKITQPTQTKIEEQVLMDANFAKSLGDLSEGYKSEYFEIGPNIQSWIYNNLTGKVKSIRDTIPGQTQEFYAEMEAFKSQANQVFNEYRKVITGAQAGMPEIMFLRKSVPTTNDSPEVFRSKARVAQAFFDRRAQLYQQALTSDNPLAVVAGGRQIDQQVAKEIADQIKAGGFGEEIKQAVGVGPKPIKEMTQGEKIAELRAAGLSIEQIRAAIAEQERSNANP